MAQRSPRRRQRAAAPPVRLSAITRAVLASMAATAAAGPALAESLIEEVVVTATKRSESAQEVPLAITALSGDFTRATNINDVKDLVSFTPGVTGNSQDSFIDAISVRGIRTQDFGVGGDPSAAFFKNDLYEGRNGSAVTSLYDMDRSEILRGPQGFLFGRNSIGGAFSVHTQRAQIGDARNSGYLDVDVAERGHLVGEGALNIPLGDNFAVRVAGYTSTEDGFVDNKAGGDDLIEHEKVGLRLSTAYENDRLGIHALVEVEDREQSGSVYRAVDEGEIWETFNAAVGPIALRGDREDADVDLSRGEADDADILTLGLFIDYDLGFATLESKTGYKDHDYFYSEDYDGTPLSISNYQQDQEGEYFQQEFRLVSQGDGPFSWYAGVAWYQEDIDTLFTFDGQEDVFCQYYGYYYNSGMTFSGCQDLYAYYGSPFTPHPEGRLTETGRIKGDYSGWAAYVDLSFDVSETLDVSLGLRYSDDEKDFSINVPNPESELGPYFAYGFSTDGFISGKKSWDDLQTRVVARWRPIDDHMLFASFTEGYKSGGFGSFALAAADGSGIGGGTTDVTQASGAQPNAFDPETVDSYELGWKGTVWDGRANTSLTAFWYDYQDLQVVVFDGGAAAVKNVGEVESWGVEGTVTAALSEHLDVYVGLSYLDSEATGLQDICGLGDPEGCEGSSLFWAPEWSGAAVINGSWPLARGGAVVGSVEAFWEGERGGGFEGLKSTEINSFVDFTVRVGYESANNWAVRLYAENLTNEFTYDGLNNNGGVAPSHFFGPKRPRTIGVSASWTFE